ncbi:MAG: bifunctional 5,10-methylenetetrahydrofolate dehydrogenase/5,10-methenyltetrahydrofolate cyclohydrolase [bacterium]|nr:bifunctional 5,10-methylenetetrahydrofolate dehydrogenase/5,10-methenyltetrahydrofolate cyclohydrolase [bacterium]
MAVALKGKEVAEQLKEKAGELLAGLGGYQPTLAIVRVGEKPDDISYERGAAKRAAAFGLAVKSCVFPADITQEAFLEEFDKLNACEEVDGILVLKPLPKQLSEQEMERRIDWRKDVDGISPVNAAKIFAGSKDGFAPCTAQAVMEVLHHYRLPVEGKRAVVVGRSMVVGRPLAMLLLQENATVTICHTRTKDLAAVCREADILVAAAGQAKMLHEDFVREGAVVLDVGIHVAEDGSMCGDVDYAAISETAAMATPVPGGIGAVTTAVLCLHVIQAAKQRHKRG